jgi:hypothetical protein
MLIFQVEANVKQVNWVTFYFECDPLTIKALIVFTLQSVLG